MYQNVLSLPMLLGMAWLDGGEVQAAMESTRTLGTMGTLLLCTSCVGGLLVGLSHFALQARLSATSVCVANTFNKTISILVGTAVFQTEVNGVGAAGLALNMCAALAYSLLPAKVETNQRKTAGKSD